MCVGDWRLGRLIRSQGTDFSTSVASQLTFQRNAQRVAVMIAIDPLFAMSTGVTELTFDNLAVVTVNFYNPMSIISLQTHGDLPTHKFTIAASEDVVTGTITEFFMPEHYLAAALKQFESDYNVVKGL